MSKKYKSPLERRLHEGPLKDWDYESTECEYTLTSKYTPDFIKDNIWIEAKGFFRTGEQRKYLAVKEQHPDKEIVFVFTNPAKPVRRGAKLTMAKWAERHGFRYYTEKTIGDLK